MNSFAQWNKRLIPLKSPDEKGYDLHIELRCESPIRWARTNLILISNICLKSLLRGAGIFLGTGRQVQT